MSDFQSWKESNFPESASLRICYGDAAISNATIKTFQS